MMTILCHYHRNWEQVLVDVDISKRVSALESMLRLISTYPDPLKRRQGKNVSLFQSVPGFSNPTPNVAFYVSIILTCIFSQRPYKLKELLSAAQTTPAQDARLGEGTSPVAVCVNQLLSFNSNS
jgi:hypothetical protein